jgi:hypothetical protein
VTTSAFEKDSSETLDSVRHRIENIAFHDGMYAPDFAPVSVKTV